MCELSALGFTLAAIEAQLARLPAEAGADELALHRALLTPWVPEQVAGAYTEAKMYAKAESLYRQFLADATKQLGANHPLTTGLMIPVDAGVAAAFLR